VRASAYGREVCITMYFYIVSVSRWQLRHVESCSHLLANYVCPGYKLCELTILFPLDCKYKCQSDFVQYRSARVCRDFELTKLLRFTIRQSQSNLGHGPRHSNGGDAGANARDGCLLPGGHAQGAIEQTRAVLPLSFLGACAGRGASQALATGERNLCACRQRAAHLQRT